MYNEREEIVDEAQLTYLDVKLLISTSISIVMNVYTNDGKGCKPDREKFMKEIMSNGFAKLSAHKLYIYLKKVVV